MDDVIDIDGAAGEGGGQVLRTALSLSLVTQRPFRLRNVRGGRAKPGLRRQHLTALRAAQQISGADVQGDALSSTEVVFHPRHIAHGMFTYARTLAALGRASLGPSASQVWFTRPVFLPTTVELVREHRDGHDVAGLRSAKDPSRGHLVLTLDA